MEETMKDTVEASLREFLQLKTLIAESCFLPEYPEANDRLLEEKDFITIRDKIESGLSDLLKLDSYENNFENMGENSMKVDFLISVLIVCGQNHEISFWTTANSKCLSKNVLDKILLYSNFKNLECLLCQSHGYFLKKVLLKIRPWLQVSTWKHFPGGVTCYCWLLSFIKIPHLGEHLGMILPSALIITDDFDVENRIVGIRCLKHIIENITKTEIGWYGHDKVILKALKQDVYRKEAILISPLFSALIPLLEKIYPQTLSSVLEWTEYDNILVILLNNMDFEQRLVIRSCYIKVLPTFICSMGLSAVRHIPRIIEILEQYLCEPTTSLESLKAFDDIVSVIWPRLDNHSEKIFVILLKLLLDVTSPGSYHQDGTLLALTDTLLYLSKMYPEVGQEVALKKHKLNFNSVYKEVINKIFIK